MDISKLVKNLGGTISKNSPAILTGLGCAGVVTTAIFSHQAGLKARDICDEEYIAMESEIRSWEGFKKVVKYTWRCYVAPAGLCLGSIACILGSNRVAYRRCAAIATAYSLTETAFREYKDKVIEQIGKGKEQKVRDEISKDHLINDPPSHSEVIITGKGEMLCYDTLSGRYFKSDIEKIRKTINELNYTLMNDVFLSLNELYDELGLTRIEMGHMLGWDVANGLIEVSFSTQLTDDDQPCIVLNYIVQPRYMYNK